MPSSNDDDLIIVATKNEGKVKEFVHMFAKIGKTVRSMADYPDLPDVVENGETFLENAMLKAKAVSEALQLPVIADDSGLCVERLAGQPGVYSARFAGEPSNDARNNEKLLKLLHEKVLPNERWDVGRGLQAMSRASFVCGLVMIDPIQDQTIQAEGECPGFILDQPIGEGGFGYDPLFYLPDYNKSMAECSPEIKNKISHRARALEILLTILQEKG